MAVIRDVMPAFELFQPASAADAQKLLQQPGSDAWVSDSTIRQKYGLLAQAAELVASPQIRNQGTLGGNVSQDARCWYYRAGWPCYRAGGKICYADTTG